MQPEDAVTMSRIATVIKKEEPLERILKIVRKCENGIDHEKLVMILMKRGYQEKVIGQLTYLGLIAETNDGGSFYSITEMGYKVLEACGR